VPPHNDLLRRARIEAGFAHRADLARHVNVLLYGPDRTKHSGFDANYLGKLERGLIRWPQRPYRDALRTALRKATDAELGFVESKAEVADTVADVDRREGLRLATTAAGILFAQPMLELLGPTRPTPLPRRISRADVDTVVAVSRIFDSWDNSYGGGLASEAVEAQLRWSAQLLTVECPDKLRPGLHRAVAEQAAIVAFMHFDAYEHADARRRFTFALQCAEAGGSWSQRAIILADMARQAIWCGQADDGLTFVETGLVRADRLTATERAMLQTVRARALAKLGPRRVQEVLTAVGRADEEFARSEPSEDPPWMRFYDHAQHHGDTAHALFDVAVSNGRETEAAERFTYAVQNHGPEYARSRVISQVKLASLTMARDDPRRAAHLGDRALDGVAPLRSLRVADDLRELHRFAGRHASIEEVTNLRERIRDVLGAAA
jgi:hypothetical protein